MSGKSAIEWTDATWNPVVGCSLVSPGCTNCYAMVQAARIQRMTKGKPSHYDGTTRIVKGKPVWTGKMAIAPDHILTAPLRWKRPRKIFVNSMGDLFHEDIPDEWIDQVFAIMALCPQHTFQVLTKRAERMKHYSVAARGMGQHWLSQHGGTECCPLHNVWLGVSAEDQARADERIPHLMDTPAAVRFVSAEPLLGPVDFTKLSPNGTQSYDALRGRSRTPDFIGRARLNWIICGGESGPGARPMHPDWARAIRDQCESAGVAFYFKQWGAWLPVDNEGDEGWEPMDGREPGIFSGVRAPLHWFQDPHQCMAQIGKTRAGRLLDGVEHNEFPEVRP